MAIPNIRDENSDTSKRRRRQSVKTDNPVGKRILEQLKGRDYPWLSSETGIPASTLSDYVQKGISRADNAVKIARALDTTVEYLMEGSGSTARQPVLRDVAETDWVFLPSYHLLEFEAAGKPTSHETMPVPKPWLKSLSAPAEKLWTTTVPGHVGDIVREGETIVCVVFNGDLVDGRIYIFMFDGRPIIRRATTAMEGIQLSTGEPATAPLIIPRHHAGAPDEVPIPIARVVGAFRVRSV